MTVYDQSTFLYCFVLLQDQRPLPGVADLVPDSTVLKGEWRYVESALKDHQSKVQEASSERQTLLSNPAHLPSEELKQAGEAVERSLQELDEQRKTFVHYINRIIQVWQPSAVMLSCACCNVNAPLL